MSVKCISSYLVTGLLSARNPQGKEENWIKFDLNGNIYFDEKHPSDCKGKFLHAGRVVTAEIGLLILCATACVEAVAYAIFTVLSAPLYPITSRPLKFCANLLDSSLFTNLWILATIFKSNWSSTNVYTKECFARRESKNALGLNLLRPQDVQEIQAWDKKYLRNIYQLGGDFIVNEVLKDMSPDAIELFKEMDAKMFDLVLAKSIFVYTMGHKKNQVIPPYLKKETLAGIKDLRLQFINKNPANLASIFKNPVEFEKGPEKEEDIKNLNKIKAIAHGELQESFFITKCWQEACGVLAEASPN